MGVATERNAAELHGTELDKKQRQMGCIDPNCWLGTHMGYRIAVYRIDDEDGRRQSVPLRFWIRFGDVSSLMMMMMIY